MEVTLTLGSQSSALSNNLQMQSKTFLISSVTLSSQRFLSLHSNWNILFIRAVIGEKHPKGSLKIVFILNIFLLVISKVSVNSVIFLNSKANSSFPKSHSIPKTFLQLIKSTLNWNSK